MIRPESLPMVNTFSMNDHHFETMILINKLALAVQNNESAFVHEIFNELIKQSEEHYQHEESMMLEKGFPPYLAHKEEHDLALDELRKAASVFRATEDMNSASEYLQSNLIPWFLRHTETMDAVTSMFLENSEVHLEFWKKLKPRNGNS